MAYIFGGNTGIRTPQEAARLRAIADALAARPHTPHTIGEGLSAIGDAIAQRRTSLRADRMESEGRAGWQSKYGNLLSELMGGSGGAVDPVPTAPGGEVPPQPDLSQANPEYLTGGGMPPPPAMENVANTQLAGTAPPPESDASISSYSPPNDPAAAAGQPDIQTAGLSITVDPQSAQQPGVTQVADSGHGFDPRMIEAWNDPWVPEGTKAVLEELLKQQLKRAEPPDYGFTTQGTDIYRTNPRTGQVERVIDNPDPAEKPTPDQSDFLFDRANGYDGSFHQWLDDKKRKEPLVQVNTGDTADAGEKKQREAAGTEEGKRWDAMEASGSVAGGTKQDLLVLDEALKTAPQGPLTGRLAEMFPGFTNAGALANSIVKRIAPTLRTPGAGSTSDIEYEGMLNSMARLSNYPEANAAINEMMKAKADIAIERADVVTAWRNEELTSKEARSKLSELNKRSIMSPKMRSLLDKVAGEGKAAEDMSDDELKAILGID